MRRLPPFAELVAFEAVARHLSFTRAAQELCLTQSAVSHRVRRLEAHFGKALIARLNPGLELTDAGEALLPELRTALETLSRLSGTSERRLRVAAGAALCNWWLAGRLPAFMARRPGVSVELLPVHSIDAPMPPADLRILWVPQGEHAPTETQQPLFQEQVFPVCSPRLLPGGAPQRDPAALKQLTLLHKASGGAGEWTWSVWLQRLGLPDASRGPEMRFSELGLVLSAAVDGAGVALARSLLVHDALRDGRLVVPLSGIEPLTSSKRHVARWRRDQADDPDVHAFVAWLVEEAASTLQSTQALLPR